MQNKRKTLWLIGVNVRSTPPTKTMVLTYTASWCVPPAARSDVSCAYLCPTANNAERIARIAVHVRYFLNPLWDIRLTSPHKAASLISTHLSLNSEGRWGTTDDFATSFLHVPVLSTALWDLANSRPLHSLMLSSHLFLCLPCLLPRFTVPCKMVLARPDERET